MTAADRPERPVIVVGTDGSPSADRAVEVAASLAGQVGAVVHVVTAYRHATPGAFALVPAFSPADTAEEILGQTAGRLRGRDVEVETHSVHAAPAEALIKVATEQGARMIVVGNKGMDSTARFLLGSVPDRVSHHAPCSVLIVRTGERGTAG